ncbi:MAG TPA: FAD-binding oxidoreductase [Myxococcales bacterium]|nr:FAD-binding oxidoreductase [Myxococcales bacterium]
MTGPLRGAGPRGRALERDLCVLLGAGAASCSPADLWAMSRDCWPRSLLWTKAAIAPHPPDVVAWPASTGEVAKVVRYAAERRIPVVPFGAGSGVCGGTVAVKGGIALDLKRLSGPPSIDLPARVVDVEAGTNGQRLEELLGAAGATLGHFPSSIYCSTVGGWLAARSAGQLSSRYGKIEDIVLAVEAVDGTGEVLRTQDAPSAGPDLLQLLVGSEGTLGIVTKARLRCWPAPTSRWMRGLRFSSVEAGIQGLRALMRSGLRPAVARLYDPLDTLLAARGGGEGRSAIPEPLRWIADGAQSEALRLALRAPALLNRLVDALPKPSLLILGFEGDGPFGEADAREEGELAIRLLRAEGAEDLGPSPGEKWLANRYRISYRQSPLFSAGAFVDTMDVATTWDRLEVLHRSVHEAVAEHAFVMAHFSHAYLEGCSIYFTFVGLAGAPAGESDPDDLETAEARYDACWKAALCAACDAGATLSHHHGVGLHKQLFLPREHGEGMRQLRALKQAFDPHGILNPGKLLL